MEKVLVLVIEHRGSCVQTVISGWLSRCVCVYVCVNSPVPASAPLSVQAARRESDTCASIKPQACVECAVCTGSCDSQRDPHPLDRRAGASARPRRVSCCEPLTVWSHKPVEEVSVLTPCVPHLTK